MTASCASETSAADNGPFETSDLLTINLQNLPCDRSTEPNPGRIAFGHAIHPMTTITNILGAEDLFSDLRIIITHRIRLMRKR
jgi:hypothetical protein